MALHGASSSCNAPVVEYASEWVNMFCHMSPVTSTRFVVKPGGAMYFILFLTKPVGVNENLGVERLRGTRQIEHWSWQWLLVADCCSSQQEIDLGQAPPPSENTEMTPLIFGYLGLRLAVLCNSCPKHATYRRMSKCCVTYLLTYLVLYTVMRCPD